MGMLIVLWVVNFVLSCLNALACGYAWVETKHRGSWAHFMNWTGAIMAACGFTWCLMILAGGVGMVIPVGKEHGHDVFLITPEMFQAAIELGYVVIILPLIGSGFAIMVDSWAHFYRRRTFGSGAIAGYNTFAQLHNVYSAVHVLPGVFRHLGSFFTGGSKDRKPSAPIIVVLVVLLSVCGGVLITRAIILWAARARLNSYRYKAAMAEANQVPGGSTSTVGR